MHIERRVRANVADLREKPVQDLVNLGARAAGSPREVASASDIVVASLPSNEASEEVALGANGVLAGAKSGDIHIDTSTISPRVIASIAEQFAGKGAEAMDAPVSGSMAQRKEGTLTVMAGGEASTVARAMPVLEAFGGRIIHVGGVGAGAATKLIDNPTMASNMVATMEALVLGVKSGLDLEKPIIARIPGPCIGLGASLALLCDIVYASENARIGDPHVKVGLVAGDGGVVACPTWSATRGPREYLMTGDLLTATEAERIGLINHVVPEDELDTRVYAMAERLAGGATRAIRWTKTSINIGLKRYAHSVMDTCLGYEMLTFASNDHREAVDAFVNKRRPEFKGD